MPLECSDGTRPTKAMARGAEANRRGSPSSAAIVSAVRSSIPWTQRSRSTRSCSGSSVRSPRRCPSPILRHGNFIDVDVASRQSAVYQAMRAVMTTRPASRSAQATRRDLLLETLALRHQLGVLARSNQRFRPVDRLFWLFLRWLWPRWQEALVLIQPATIDRWHRKGIRQCWRRGSRHPGRPRIDSPCCDLIRRMAAENCLWGAPRIHGELLKLGITISERSVSRYLHGRPTNRSQTWRTFLANTFGNRASISPVMFADADDEEIRDASDAVRRRPAQSAPVSRPSTHGPTTDPAHSRRRSTLGMSLAQRHSPTGARISNSRDPPRNLSCRELPRVLRRSFF